MIVAHTGIQSDVSKERLPADAVPALFAYSLNRKLRYLYDGEYFRFRQASGGEHDYPSKTPDLSEDVFVVKIYDQKLKHGVPVQDAVQVDQSKQPKLTYDGTIYEALFDQKEYYDVPNLASFIGQNFTITVIGDGPDVPRPLIGIWGVSDVITFETGDLATRFTFNSNLGTIHNQDDKATQCFSGYDPTQNGNHVMTVRTSTGQGSRARDPITPSFTNISIGRQNQRLYKGTFVEGTMHLSELTSLGSSQLFETTRIHHGS